MRNTLVLTGHHERLCSLIMWESSWFKAPGLYSEVAVGMTTIKGFSCGSCLSDVFFYFYKIIEYSVIFTNPPWRPVFCVSVLDCHHPSIEQSVWSVLSLGNPEILRNIWFSGWILMQSATENIKQVDCYPPGWGHMMHQDDLLQAEILAFLSLEQHVMNLLSNKSSCVCFCHVRLLYTVCLSCCLNFKSVLSWMVSKQLHKNTFITHTYSQWV